MAVMQSHGKMRENVRKIVSMGFYSSAAPWSRFNHTLSCFSATHTIHTGESVEPKNLQASTIHLSFHVQFFHFLLQKQRTVKLASQRIHTHTIKSQSVDTLLWRFSSFSPRRFHSIVRHIFTVSVKLNCLLQLPHFTQAAERMCDKVNVCAAQWQTELPMKTGFCLSVLNEHDEHNFL